MKTKTRDAKSDTVYRSPFFVSGTVDLITNTPSGEPSPALSPALLSLGARSVHSHIQGRP